MHDYTIANNVHIAIVSRVTFVIVNNKEIIAI